MKKTGKVDKSVGENIIKYRIAAGLGRRELAEAIGITYQQMQKYEKGINRISVSRLLSITEILNVPVSNFFPAEMYNNDHQHKLKPEIIEYLSRIKDEAKLEIIHNVVKSIAIMP